MHTHPDAQTPPPCRIAVIGSDGRIGRMLRLGWAGRADLAVRWTTRRGPADAVDPLAMPLAALATTFAGYDVILNLAGPVPQPGRSDDAATMSMHPSLAAALLKAAQAVGVPNVVLLSSAAVYGDSPGLLTEATPPAPRSTYGQAKLAMERVAAQSSAPLQSTVLRLGNVAGADMLLGGAAERGGATPVRLHMLPDGSTPLRSTIGPATLARVLNDIMLALHHGASVPALLNLAAPGAVTMGDLLDAAGLPWVPVPAPQGTIARVTLSTLALERLVCFAPEECTATGIVDQWRDFQRRAASAEL